MNAAPLTCASTGLRVYRSARAARAAHRKAGFRVRVFQCGHCSHFHVSSEPKGDKSQ